MAHILIADDEPIVRHLYGAAFEVAGHSVGLVADGDEALEVIAARSVDLLVLDWMMPRLSGFEVMRALRMSAQHCRLPVIMLTMRTGVQDRTIADNALVDFLVSKTSAPDWLVYQAEQLIIDKARVAPVAPYPWERRKVARYSC
ncbi:MAG: response regulator [Novosphingobium sp.]|nr:response regulator [Novosphingobium sp.]